MKELFLIVFSYTYILGVTYNLLSFVYYYLSL
jgi:hypothetical protein